MSRRRRLPPPELDDDDDELEDEEDDEDVEYFVLVVLPESAVLTSVPKSVQSPQTSNSAPSTFTVLGVGVSAPHISHWTIPGIGRARV
jgi:hypothetical protein